MKPKLIVPAFARQGSSAVKSSAAESISVFVIVGSHLSKRFVSLGCSPSDLPAVRPSRGHPNYSGASDSARTPKERQSCDLLRKRRHFWCRFHRSRHAQRAAYQSTHAQLTRINRLMYNRDRRRSGPVIRAHWEPAWSRNANFLLRRKNSHSAAKWRSWFAPSSGGIRLWVHPKPGRRHCTQWFECCWRTAFRNCFGGVRSTSRSTTMLIAPSSAASIRGD